MTKDPNKDANNMGGPSFHPELRDKTPKRDTMDKNQAAKGGEILAEDQVPPL